MFSKIDVNGPNTHPVYSFCRLKSELYHAASNTAYVIPWSWSKFLINEEGQVAYYFDPVKNPLSFEDKIEAML